MDQKVILWYFSSYSARRLTLVGARTSWSGVNML